MKKIILLMLCLQSLVTFSQNSLKGTIINKTNKEPLPGVLVFFPDLKTGVTTNSNGVYEANKLPKTKTIVQVKLLGYKTIIKTIDLSTTSTFDIELEESVVEAEEIVVTGTSHATELKRNPAAIISIDSKYLSQTTSNNIIDAMAKVPGLSALSSGPNVSKPYIRGLGFNRILTLFDGVRQDGQQWGDEHGIEIDQFLVDRIEIVKGPASLIYGSDALAGVINMLPAHAAAEGKIVGGWINSYQTNNKQIASSLDLAGNIKGYVFGVRASKKMASTYKNKVDGNVFGTKYDETDFNAYLGVNKSWGYSRINFSMYDNIQEIPDGDRDSSSRKFTKILSEDDTIRPIVSDDELQSYSIGGVRQRVQHYRLYTDNNIFFKNSKLGIKLGVQQSHRREYENPSHRNEAGLNLLLNTGTYDIKYHLPEWKGIESTIGINGMVQQNKNYKAMEFLIPDYESYDFGPFAFIKKSFGKIDLAGGVRYDVRSIKNDDLYTKIDATGHGEVVEYNPNDTTIVKKFDANSNTFSGFSGSLGATFLINEALSVKLNVARGYRAPNITEFAAMGVHPGTDYKQVSDPNSKPEFSLQQDLGIFYDNEHISGSIELFNNNISNYFYNEKLSSLQGGDSLYIENGDAYKVFKIKQTQAQLYGAEFSLDIHPHPLDWLHFENTASFTYGLNRGGNGIKVTDSTHHLPLITPFHSNSELRADFKKKLGIINGLYIKIGMQYFADQNLIYSAYGTETPTKGYVLIDAGIGTDFVTKKGHKICSLSITGTNLADEAYQSNMSRLKYFDNYPVNHTGRSGIFNMGRNISFKLVIPLDVNINRKQ